MSTCSAKRDTLPSATPGKKHPGSSTPKRGWRMRASASAPARHLRLRSIFGWYHISNQPFPSASSISMRGRGRALMVSRSERRSASPSLSIAPDQFFGPGFSVLISRSRFKSMDL
jgi:hypothetical protein